MTRTLLLNEGTGNAGLLFFFAAQVSGRARAYAIGPCSISMAA